MRLSSVAGGAMLLLHFIDAVDDLADEAVLLRVFGIQPEIAARVILDPRKRLTCLTCKQPVDALSHLQDLARFDFDVARAAAVAAGRLMQEEARVRQTEPV